MISVTMQMLGVLAGLFPRRFEQAVVGLCSSLILLQGPQYGI